MTDNLHRNAVRHGRGKVTLGVWSSVRKVRRALNRGALSEQLLALRTAGRDRSLVHMHAHARRAEIARRTELGCIHASARGDQ